MKKRIGTLYNKPIIEGDINLKTPNEIHKDELKGGGRTNSFYYKALTAEGLEVIKGHTKYAPWYTICAMKDGELEEFYVSEEYYIDNSYGTFKLLDIPYFIGGVTDNEIVNRYIITGDLYARMSVFTGMSPEEIKELAKDMIVEVTKEEYYKSMNN